MPERTAPHIERFTRPNASLETFGFSGDEQRGWSRPTWNNSVSFRLLTTLEDLRHAEILQEEIFGVSERDLIPANELIVVAETGGAVIGAFTSADPDHAAGVLVGWGGFVGRPRIVSDFLAVRPAARNLGLAAELKRLQAALALDRGFVEIVWTVDPLRAANARLNFNKLGAVGVAYEFDRYGSTFATGLYGGMPSDRLHLRWEITDPANIARLQTDLSVPRVSPPQSIAEFTPRGNAPFVAVRIPADIDAVLASDLESAFAWRLRVRDQLTAALAEGFVVVGFVAATESASPALLLQRG